MFEPKPFPIPVTALLGPGSQQEDEPVAMIAMPRDMATYRPPVLPEPEELAGHAGAVEVLHHVLRQMRQHRGESAVLEIGSLAERDRTLLNQVLGEGEVAAQVAGPAPVQAQESVFAGVWRVLHGCPGGSLRDTIEIGRFPACVEAAAVAEGGMLQRLADDAPRPAGTMNAPALLEELRERQRQWRPGVPAHVVNLSLLPLTPGDSELLEAVLGRGSVLVLSRGYGNCRVVATRAAHIWRVTYFNSQDMIILDTLEVGPVPEVACAAPQDLEDSAERLAEVLQWVERG